MLDDLVASLLGASMIEAIESRFRRKRTWAVPTEKHGLLHCYQPLWNHYRVMRYVAFSRAKEGARPTMEVGFVKAGPGDWDSKRRRVVPRSQYLVEVKGDEVERVHQRDMRGVVVDRVSLTPVSRLTQTSK
ncbi:hypothetical protein [Haloglycomyces albus]|uniref:hypothetical protein n=1 Tax=Haloglycomyces albus TaxID=526067 RepID=UPI00046D8C86|nr:hypothetical protein [Haloglycomyces albus]